jgi:hypothetical protein
MKKKRAAKPVEQVAEKEEVRIIPKTEWGALAPIQG